MPIEYAAEQVLYDPQKRWGLRIAAVELDASLEKRVRSNPSVMQDIVGAGTFHVPLSETSVLRLMAALVSASAVEDFFQANARLLIEVSRQPFEEFSHVDVAPGSLDFAKEVLHSELVPVLGSPWKSVAALGALVGGAAGFVTLGPGGVMLFVLVIAGGIIVIRAANALGEGIEHVIRRKFGLS